MRDYRDLRRVYNLTLTQAFFALLEQKVLDVWETLARMGYDRHDYFDFTEKRWKALPVERQIAYASQYQKWYAERLGVGVEQSFQGSVFRLVPPGKFTMGSPLFEYGRFSDEEQKEVDIPTPLWVGRYPVTQKEYERILEEKPSLFIGENNPVEHVNFEEAQTYSVKAGCQLLSEAEWEYTYRAGTTHDYAFDHNLYLATEYAWFRANSNNRTHPVGEKRANAWGLQDMHGNVYEWCNEWYDQLENERVIRGGAFYCHPNILRSAFRIGIISTDKLNNTGIRVCKPYI